MNDHDFRSEATGVGISYGICDPPHNRGAVCVGISHDTPAFAAHSIATCWKREGSHRWGRAPKLLVLADSGGSNSCTSWAWKTEIQSQLCNPFRVTVTIAHYPTGASKWNPIEHRLFSEISKNWAAEPLDSYEKMLKFIRTTRTQTGLAVTAYLDRKNYPTGLKPPPPVNLLAPPQTQQATTAMELHHRTQPVKLILRRPLGDSVVRVHERYYLSAVDETGVGNGMYFLAERQTDRAPRTLKEAFEVLKPQVVREAEARGANVRRQGEWFAIPTKFLTWELMRDVDRGIARYEARHVLGRDGHHELEEAVIYRAGPRKGEVYARGALKHIYRASIETST